MKQVAVSTQRVTAVEDCGRYPLCCMQYEVWRQGEHQAKFLTSILFEELEFTAPHPQKMFMKISK
jgi:hypothetical protein